MDDRPCREFFLEPQQTFQRRYEALRAIFVGGEPLARVAERFGYKVAALKSIACRFRAVRRRGVTPPLFLQDGRGRPPGQQGSADKDGPELPEVADHRRLSLASERTVQTRVAGIFLFLPLLAKLGFDRCVAEARYPASAMVPGPSALLSLLSLKLLDKERRSHINDFNF